MLAVASSLLLFAAPSRAQDAGVAVPDAATVPAMSATDEAAIRAALEVDQRQAAVRAGAAPGQAPIGAAAPAPFASGPAPTAGAAGEAPASLGAQTSVRPPGMGLLNPDTSVILDAAFGYYGRRSADFEGIGVPPAGDDPAAGVEGFTLQELEIGFRAAIDPYLEGAVYLAIPNLEGVEVEEGYLFTTALPWNLQLKAGSFRSQVGRNNTQHLHSQHFVRRPLMTPVLFGVDGFRGPGAQASVLMPGLPWFATLYAEAFSIGPPEEAAVTTFGGGGRGPASLVYTAVLEQFWAPSDATSILLGLNFASGIASTCTLVPCEGDRRSYLYGADLHLKWRRPDVVGESNSVTWTTEYFARTLAEGGPTEGALYTEPLVRFARRWTFGGRFDVIGLPSGANLPRRYGVAASLTFAPTEFSRVRLYAQELWGPDAPTALVGFLQAEISMGAHGAHAF